MDLYEILNNVYFQAFIMIITVIFLINIFMELFQTQNNVVESLINKNDAPDMEIMAKNKLKTLKDEIQHGEDMLRVDKYKTHYEDLLIDLDELINQELLSLTIRFGDNIVSGKNGIIKSGDDTHITNMNELYKLKEILNSTMEYLDKK